MAVDSAGVQAGITLAADHLVAVTLLSSLAKGGLQYATLQSPPSTKWTLSECCSLIKTLGPSSSYLPAKTRCCWSHRMPSLSHILVLTFSLVLLSSTTTVMVLPVRIFTKICISVPAGDAALPPSRGETRVALYSYF